MNISRRPQSLSLLPRLGLLAVIALVLIGCGSGPNTPVAMSPAEVAMPTPVPTTAPLSLPPADDSLPALAPLPASVAITEAVADDGEAASTAASSTDSDPTDGRTTNVASTVQQDGAPTPTAAVVSTEPEASADDTILSITSADRWSDCVVLAAQKTPSLATMCPRQLCV